MELRGALKRLVLLGSELAMAEDIEACQLVEVALDRMPKGEPLALRPADQANALDLLAKMQEVVGDIVYEVARQEVLDQIKNIAGNARAAHRLGQKAVKAYDATRKTWDGLHGRILLLEEDLGAHTRQADDAALWTQLEALGRIVTGSEGVDTGMRGCVAKLEERLEKLKDLEVHHATLAGQVKGDGSQLGLITRVSRLATAVKALSKLKDRLEEIERSGMPMARELERKLEALAGKLDAEDRAHSQLAQTVRGRGTNLGHSTRITQLELDVRNLRRQLKDLGEHPALV